MFREGFKLFRDRVGRLAFRDRGPATQVHGAVAVNQRALAPKEIAVSAPRLSGVDPSIPLEPPSLKDPIIVEP